MIRVSHFGKLGDLMYALPVLRALHRTTGQKVQLLTSGSCWQMAPLLWEQPYIGEVELDDSQPHATVPIGRGAIFPGWQFFQLGDGINLSLQPCYFRDAAPISWTRCYMEAAGITELTVSDCVALPSLVNHRRWLYGVDVEQNGKRQGPPMTIIVAPETDTLDELFPAIWQSIISRLAREKYEVIVVGTRALPNYFQSTDLRGRTSVPVLARLIAEACGFIGAHSFPWHLARHSETPAVCLQTWRDGLARCLPVDTPCTWLEPTDWPRAVSLLLAPATMPQEHPWKPDTVSHAAG